jgi:hypothetical protein
MIWMIFFAAKKTVETEEESVLSETASIKILFMLGEIVVAFSGVGLNMLFYYINFLNIAPLKARVKM